MACLLQTTAAALPAWAMIQMTSRTKTVLRPDKVCEHVYALLIPQRPGAQRHAGSQPAAGTATRPRRRPNRNGQWGRQVSRTATKGRPWSEASFLIAIFLTFSSVVVDHEPRRSLACSAFVLAARCISHRVPLSAGASHSGKLHRHERPEWSDVRSANQDVPPICAVPPYESFVLCQWHAVVSRCLEGSD
jgi:hypothetical protein